jgi:hypothetical protein
MKIIEENEKIQEELLKLCSNDGLLIQYHKKQLILLKKHFEEEYRFFNLSMVIDGVSFHSFPDMRSRLRDYQDAIKKLQEMINRYEM